MSPQSPVRSLFLIALCLLGCSQNLWAMRKLSCDQLLRVDSEVISQLAELRLQLQITSEPALRSRLEADFQTKVLELTARGMSSQTLTAEIRRALQAVTQNPNPASTNLDPQLDAQLDILKQSIPDMKIKVAPALVNLDMQRLHDQQLRENTANARTLSGVMWSAEDKYVALRPLTQGRKTHIYRVADNTLLPFHPTNGLLSARGTHFAEQEGLDIRVVDLKDLSEVDKLRGELLGEADLFTDDFIVTKIERKSIQADVYWLHMWKHGTFELGTYFSLSLRYNRVAFFEGEHLRILDLNTGQALTTPFEALTAEKTAQGYFRRDLFFFEVDRQKKVLRLQDLTVHDVPPGPAFLQEIPGQQIFAHHHKSNGIAQITFRSLVTDESYTFEGHRFYHDPHQQRLLIPSADGNHSTLIDLVTWKQQQIPGYFDRFVGQGRFLQASKDLGGGKIQHSIHSITESRTQHLVLSGALFPLGQGEFWIMEESAAAAGSWLTEWEHLGHQFLSVGDGTHSTGISNTGRYLVQSLADRILIFTLELPDRKPATTGDETNP